MTPERIEQRFADAKARAVGALLPYFTSGFPDCQTVAELIRCADALGVTAVEIGVPYSDSIADGPVIQSSFHYALSRGHRVDDVFEMVADVRNDVRCALIAMLSSSIMYRFGLEAFMTRAASAGFDGLILPDLPIEESATASAAAAAVGLRYVGLVAPTTTPHRREQIARASTGFIYQLAVAGTTGERTELPVGLREAVVQLRLCTDLPICVGFGVNSGDQVRQVCELADGAIVGSALVRRISNAIDQNFSRAQVVDSIGSFIEELMAGVRR